jgi:pimeloyl-ACP methyl ester carboxylesterase
LIGGLMAFTEARPSTPAGLGQRDRPRRSLLPPRLSGFSTPAGRTAYRRAYEQTLGALWPAPVEHAYLPTRFGTTHALLSGPPDGSPVVLLHGAGLSATSWYRTIGPLAKRFRIIAVDHVFDRGLGQQAAIVRGEGDAATWVADLLGACGLRSTSLVGLSQGAWVAAATARYHPELTERLVLLAPAATIAAFRAPFWLLFRGLQHALPAGDPRVRARRTFEMVNAEPEPELLEQTALGLEHFIEQRPPVLPRRFPAADIRRITAPTSLLVAEREILYEPGAALRRARRLFPNLVHADVVPGAGHFVTLAAPERVNDEIMRSLTAPTSRRGTCP